MYRTCMRFLGLCLLLTGFGCAAASDLTLTTLLSSGRIQSVRCYADVGFCEGQSLLAPNALAGALGLPLPNISRNGYDTAGRGWRVQSEEIGSSWKVTLTPWGRVLNRAELTQYPAPAPVVASPPVRSKPAGPCVVAVDVRGLGNFQRDMTSIVYDVQGYQLWPDPKVQRGVTVQFGDGDLHTYVTSEAALKTFGKTTRVRALRVQPNKFSPTGGALTDAVLGPTSAAAFKKAGQSCRVVYLMSGP